MTLAAFNRTNKYAERYAKKPPERDELLAVQKYYPGGVRQFLRDYKP